MATNPEQWQFENLDELERLEFVWCVAHMHLMVEPDRLLLEQRGETPENISSKNPPSDSFRPTHIDKTFPQEAQQTNISAYPQDTETKPSDNFIEEKATDNKASPVSIPDPFPLPHPAEIGKALLPLARRIAGIWKNQIDIDATVEQTAEANGLITVAMKAPLERQYEIHLFVDVSPSMQFWDDLTAGVATLFRWQGFFRDVRVWQLDTSSDKMRLYSDETRIERDLASLITPRKNRLFMVITDTLGKAWRSQDAYQQLAFLGKTHSVTIAHIFPQYLWSRTSLFRASERPLTAAKSNCANSQLQRGGRKLRTEEDIYQFPILNLLPEHFATWAKFLTGEQGKFIQGVILKQTDSQTYKEKKQEKPIESTEPEALLRDFLLDATPPARKLAQILAAVPLIPPVMRLAQKQFLEESEYWHLAEVFFSGLLKRSEFSPEDVSVSETWYEFLPGIRELLLASSSVMETTEIWREIGSFVESKYGSPRSFQALIPDSKGSIDDPLSNRDLYFAEVDAAVFMTWGGKYAVKGKELLEIVETNKKPKKPSGDGASDKNVLESFEFEAEVAIITFETDINKNRSQLETILLIEDNPKIANEIQYILQQQGGFTVILHEDFETIMDYARSGEVDLILLNYWLNHTYHNKHKINGVELARMIRSDTSISSDLVMIGLSTITEKEPEFRTYCDGFYPKPVVDSQAFITYLTTTFHLKRRQTHQLGKHYAIAIGINQSRNPTSSLPAAQYAVRDASMMQQWFSNKGFEKVDLLSDVSYPPTHAGWQQFWQENWLRNALSAQDTLWFYFCGYGVHQQGRDYLILTDTDWENLEETALPLRDLVQLLQSSGAGKVVLLLDADRDRHINQGITTKSTSDLVSSLEQQLQGELSRDQGLIIISASSPEEGAYEIGELQQGSFTYALLQALETTQGNLSIEHLEQFLRIRVTELNQQYNLPTQSPESFMVPRNLREWIPFPSNLQVFEYKTLTVSRRGETTKQDTKLAQYFTETLTDNVILEMVSIPGGTFTMGSPESEKDSRNNERPQHNVTVPPFFMGKYPITQAQWKAIASRTDLKVKIDLNEDPSHFKNPYQKDQETIDRWLRPVEQVNWYEAVEFCQRLSKLTGRDYRLSSEAEWEYACRAFTEPLDLEKREIYPPFYFGETLTGELANYNASRTYADEPKGEYRKETTPVGQFPPNAFGLYDLHGNVWEWCADDWHENYEGVPTDGSAWVDTSTPIDSAQGKQGKPPSNESNQEENINFENTAYSTKNEQNNPYSVMRGGSLLNNPDNCRSAFRNNDYRDNRYDYYIGFRVVCVFGKTL